MPVLDEEYAAGRTIRRTVAERVDVRHSRRLGGERVSRSRSFADAYRPSGVPIAYLPRLLRSVGGTRIGQAAGGGKVRLSTTVVLTNDGDVHSTVIDGESREFLQPTRFPYTAVCKIEKWSLDATGTWVSSGSYGTGFLIGRRILLTSGHAFEDDRLSSGMFAIKVIPACWANQSVFGPGMITWVTRRRWWHSDSGNDMQVCQLADPVGDRLGFFGARVYDSDWEDMSVWTMAGFPYDRSKFGMSVQHGISVRDDDDGDDIELDGSTYDTTQVESDADEASGASGSPLFAWFGADNPCAIGIHSGYQTDWTVSGDETWSCAAGGDGLVEIVRWAREHWE
jgi:V8-like Glu-specific endopeptidase